VSWDVLRVASEIEDDVGRADSRVGAFDEFTAAILARFLVHFSCAANSEDACRKNVPTCTTCRHGDGQDLFEWVVGVDGSGGGSMFIPATAAAD